MDTWVVHYLLAIVNYSAINTGVWVPLLSILLGICPDVELRDYMVILCLIFWETVLLFFTVAAPFPSIYFAGGREAVGFLKMDLAVVCISLSVHIAQGVCMCMCGGHTNRASPLDNLECFWLHSPETPHPSGLKSQELYCSPIWESRGKVGFVQ